MNKRLISLLLVVMMISMLLPMTVLAAPKESESGNVHINVYGRMISDYLYSDADKDIAETMGLIKTQIQASLAGETIPECTITLENSDGAIYHFNKQENPDKISDSIEFIGDISFLNNLSFLSEIFNGVDTLPTINKFYQTYVSTEYIPDGKYTLHVDNIDQNGYSLKAPATGSLEDVEVQLNKHKLSFLNPKETHVGAMKVFSREIKIGFDKHIIGMALPGIYLNRVDPGFSFIKTDLADTPLTGADFLMIDRNETAKIVKAMVSLGKDTFINAMKLIGTEGYTWEELNVLNAFLNDGSGEEGEQSFGLDPLDMSKLVTTYWSLIEASASMPIKNFLNEDLRIPALLKASSDDGGIVSFTENSNITLTWTIDALFAIAGVTVNSLEDVKKIDFENEQLDAILDEIITLAQKAGKTGLSIFEEAGGFTKDFINDWVYPVLQNDEIPSQIAKMIDKDSAPEDELTWKDFIPDHAILTPKMPASDYILMEEKAPEGYMRNPFFYTIHLTWNTEKEDVREWCYVTVADLGIIGPYLAENYYTFFRNNSFVSVADKILNNVIGKENANVLNWALTTDESVTAATLDYWAKMISANAAGDSENSSEEAVANELTQYVIKHGNNAQSLMQFAYQVANRGRAVISSEVNEEWHFYNFNDSIHTSYATKITALLNGAKESLKEENDTLVSSAVKKAIDTQISIIGKVDSAITRATASFTAAVKDATAKVAESVKENVKATAKSVVSSLLKRLFK